MCFPSLEILLSSSGRGMAWFSRGLRKGNVTKGSPAEVIQQTVYFCMVPDPWTTKSEIPALKQDPFLDHSWHHCKKRKLGEETDIGIRAIHRLRAWHVTYLVALNKFTKERKKCNFPEFFLPIWYNLFCVCSESLSLEINLIWLS